jgi:kinesin family member 18/19
MDLWTYVIHPDYASSSQQLMSDTKDVSSSQSSIELVGMIWRQLLISD